MLDESESDRMILGDGAIFSTDSEKTGLNNNVVIVGASGSGKTVSVAEPKILETRNHNLIVTVTKRRIVEKYAPILGKRGYQVWDLNFVEPRAGNVGFDLMDQISNKVMLTLLGHATKELDPYAYEDSHMIINLIYMALVLVGIVEIIRARKWKRNTEGNMIINIFLHLLLPTAILLLPVIIGVPYWVIWEYARDSFIVLTLSAFLLYIGGLMKLKK